MLHRFTTPICSTSISLEAYRHMGLDIEEMIASRKFRSLFIFLVC
jgi:hypothetical protein